MSQYALPDLPVTWRPIPFGQIAIIAYGKGLQSDSRVDTGNIPVYGSNGVIGYHDIALHPGPSIVIGRKGSAGTVQYVNEPFWCIDTAFYLDNIHPLVDLEFLAYILKVIDLSRFSIVVGVPGINRTDIEKLKIPLPTLQEQQEIVRILRQTDQLLEFRTAADEYLANLSNTLFYDLFLNKPEQAKIWKTEKLEKYLSSVTSGPRGWGQYYAEKGARFIRVQDVQHGEIVSEDPAFIMPPNTPDKERARILANDVLITITGTIGRVAVARLDLPESYVSQHVAIVRLDGSLSPEYVAAYLNHPLGGQIAIQKLNYGQTKPGLNLGQIQSIRIPIPPPSLIERFELLLEQVRKLISDARQSKISLENLQTTMRIAAFSGVLTSSYRSRSEKTLSAAAKKRDQSLLQEIKATEQEQKKIVAFRNLTAQALSESQIAVLDVIKNNDGYTTLQSFDASFPVNQIQGNLDLLAELGLIKAVNIPVAPGKVGRIFYTKVYRSLQPKDNVRETDLKTLREAPEE